MQKLSILAGIVAVMALTSCAGSRPTKAGEERVAVGACEVPRLEGIGLDGHPEQWADRGLRVDLFTHIFGPDRGDEGTGITLRLGWDERGLLFLATVRDTTPIEPDNVNQIYAGDSLEIFLGAETGSPVRYLVLVAPGVDGKHPDLRFKVYDERPDRTKEGIVPVFSRTKTADGYAIEGVLPLGPVGKAAKAGSEMGFNLVVNDTDSGSRTRSSRGWFPAAPARENLAATYRLRLGERAGPPIRAVVSTEFEHFRRVDLAIKALPRSDGQPSLVIAADARGELGRVILPAGPGLREGQIKFPFPVLGAKPGEVWVSVDGDALPPVVLPDLDAMRKEAFEEADFNFNGHVFSGDKFPVGDFKQPNLVEDLAGPYTVTTTFYDADYHPVTTPAKPGRYGAVTVVTAGKWTRTIYSTLYRSPRPWAPAWRSELDVAVKFTAEFGLDPGIVAARAEDVRRVFVQGFFDRFDNDDDTAELLAGLSESKPDEAMFERFSAGALSKRWWYKLKKQLGVKTYPRVVDLPTGYVNDPAVKWPVLVFLHGTHDQANAPGIAEFLGRVSGKRFIVVVPRCADDEWSWQPWKIADVLDEVAAEYRTDPDRVYLTGFSMGGYGTWATGIEYPERFAALAAIAGVGDARDVGRIKDVPIWVFHGDRDPNVSFEKDTAAVDALKKIGGRVVFTPFPGVGHTAQPALTNKALYDWLLRQRRGQPDQGAAGGE